MPAPFKLKLSKKENNIVLPLVSDVFLTLSNSIPLMILYSLRRKQRTLSEISRRLGLVQSIVLPELLALQTKNVLVSLSKSRKIFYRLADDRILQAMDLLKRISHRRVKQAGTMSALGKTSRISRGGA